MSGEKVCSVKKCGLPHFANGLCESHNRRKWNWEKGGVRPTIPLDAPIQAPKKAAGRHTIRLEGEQEAAILAHLAEVDCTGDASLGGKARCRGPEKAVKTCKRCKGKGRAPQSVYSKILEILESWARRNPPPAESSSNVSAAG